jgi:hypothetical protein
METVFAKEILRTNIKQSYHYQSIANKALGQIVFLCKLLKDGEWKSLFIAKGHSKQFNDERFKNNQ